MASSLSAQGGRVRRMLRLIAAQGGEPPVLSSKADGIECKRSRICISLSLRLRVEPMFVADWIKSFTRGHLSLALQSNTFHRKP